MSSVKREYSLPASAIADVSVTSGTGTLNNRAQVYIDPRLNSVFRVDISTMVGQDNYVRVTLDTFAGAPGAVPGKEITILFSGHPNIDRVNLNFTSKFGPNFSNNFAYMDGDTNGVPMSMKIMSNGTDFVVLTATLNAY